MAKLEELTGNILLVEFPSQRQLTGAFMRIQEHYESPRFRGERFTRRQLRSWYLRESGEKYDSAWVAFNLPWDAFKPFYAGHFGPREGLARDERALLNLLESRMNREFYVIGTYKNGGEIHDLRHEVAHALFCTNPEYATAVLQTIQNIDLGDMALLEAGLQKTGGYHKEVWPDEIQAYLVAGLDVIVESESARRGLRRAEDCVKSIFNRFVAEQAGLSRFKINIKKIK